jgi:hypothetical protein
MQNRDDLLFPVDGMLAAVERLRATYEKAGHAEQFRARIGTGPHEFNVAMQEEAFAWLDQQLS